VTTTGDTGQRVPVAGRDAGAPLPGRTAAGGLAGLTARAPWCWPALLTLALGFYQVGRPELWRDELASWTFATRPLPSLMDAARRSGATQLAYYLALHVWIAAFGDSVDAMRALSVLAMAAAAACVTLIGRRLAGTRAGLISGLVFAVLPSASRFAQEVRFYALAVLAATLATLLLLHALDRPSARRWVGYGLCLALLGYIDVVALSMVAGHAAGVALRWWRDRDARVFRFVPAAAAGLAACLPLAAVGLAQQRYQIDWVPRPGMSFFTASFFARNLFYSTSVAAALIVLAVLAWAAAWREAAFMTAVAVLPVAAVWLISQGPQSYFFPRYLLMTAASWAVLAGIGLSRIDVRAAVAAVIMVAALGAGDQQVIREPGAHNWATYPVGAGGYYPGFAQAAAVMAGQVRAGDGAVYQGDGTGPRWLMAGYGMQYYLSRDLRHTKPLPRELFIAEPPAQAGVLYPRPCRHLAACIGNERRIWVVGDTRNLSRVLTRAQAALLRQRGYRLSFAKDVPGLTVFLLVRDAAPPR